MRKLEGKIAVVTGGNSVLQRSLAPKPAAQFDQARVADFDHDAAADKLICRGSQSSNGFAATLTPIKVRMDPPVSDMRRT